MTAAEYLQKLFQIIEKEASENPGFAARVEQVFAGTAVPSKKKTKKKTKRAAALVDPQAVLAAGNELLLRQELEKLDVKQLKDIVAEFGMDPAKLVMKWRKPERIMQHIMDTAAGRMQRGNAFRQDSL